MPKALHILEYTYYNQLFALGPVAKFQCWAGLGGPIAAGRRRQARDFAGKILG